MPSRFSAKSCASRRRAVARGVNGLKWCEFLEGFWSVRGFRGFGGYNKGLGLRVNGQGLRFNLGVSLLGSI